MNRQELETQGIDPLRESLDTFAALEGGPAGLLDFEAAAAVPEKELKKYLQASQIDGSLLANFRQVWGLQTPAMVHFARNLKSCTSRD